MGAVTVVIVGFIALSVHAFFRANWVLTGGALKIKSPTPYPSNSLKNKNKRHTQKHLLS
jgi:hypothetical protein